MFNFLKKSITLLPWVGKESIYDYIKRNLDSEGKLPLACEELPDSTEFYEDKPFRWVAGAMDGVMGHHASPGEIDERVMKISKLIRQQVSMPSNSTRRDTYIVFMNDDILGYIDPLLEFLRKQSDLKYNVLYDEAKWFAKEGAHRGVVKMGIALLGLFNCEKDEELIITLGKSEEFTLYAAVALQNGCTNSNQKIFELAQSVHGWGKIHLVERLSADTKEIKDWLLRRGCDNSIMPEYLSYTCAAKGELDQALVSSTIDQELYTGAGIILSALIAGGPAENIDDYDKSMPVVSNYLKHSGTYCHTIDDLLVVIHIKGFLKQEDDVWNKRFENGWNKEIRDSCLAECDRIILQDRWNNEIWNDLGSEDNYKKNCAIRAARELGIDTWEQLYAELHAKPLDSGLYFELMRTENIDRIRKLVTFAERNLPLKELATGPGTELGLGPEYKAHGCLDFVLQDLDKYEGVGGKLILAGLNSAVIRNRNMALKTLETWSRKNWPEGAAQMLEKLYSIEPDANVKQRIKGLLI